MDILAVKNDCFMIKLKNTKAKNLFCMINFKVHMYYLMQKVTSADLEEHYDFKGFNCIKDI